MLKIDGYLQKKFIHQISIIHIQKEAKQILPQEIAMTNSERAHRYEAYSHNICDIWSLK